MLLVQEAYFLYMEEKKNGIIAINQQSPKQKQAKSHPRDGGLEMNFQITKLHLLLSHVTIA